MRVRAFPRTGHGTSHRCPVRRALQRMTQEWSKALRIWFLDRKILTVDPADSIAEAVPVKNVESCRVRCVTR